MKSKKRKPKPPKHKPTKVMPMTPTLISVINQSAKVSDSDVEAAVLAIGKQLAEHVAPVWGMVPALEFVPAGQKPNGIPCTLSDTPDVPGAAGYHDEGPDGVPYIKVFILDGEDWRVTLSHEAIELAGDAAANLWADAPDGADYARELCDAVESDTYEVDGVPVSNFVYPAFFDPNAQADEKLDYLGNLKAPFTMTPGGYEIRRTEPGKVTQVFAARSNAVQVQAGVTLVFGAKFPEHKKAAKIEKARRRRCKRVA